jgi:DNA polymerase-3 subunit epsilon
MSRKYAIVDLETTGGMPRRDKITEIGIVVFDGVSIIDSFQSLVNPERSIPPNITRITGITNEMVAEAPKFYELAKTVIELTESCVFVAHNVRFDYSFLVQEFKSLGYTFTRRQLCTVRMSRKAFPGLSSYSLGNLIKYFQIEVNYRHRAFDDAMATTTVLKKIFEVQGQQQTIKKIVSDSIRLTKLPQSISIETLEALPEKCGVYYMLDAKKEIIYVGKSINIKKRIKQHFSKTNKKADRLLQYVHDIDYELTETELLSLVKESYDIKKHQPEVNKIQKTRAYQYAVVQNTDKSGYYKYEVKKAKAGSEALSYYGSKKSALQHIEQIAELYQLCHKVNGLDKRLHSCFNYELNKCMGACIGEEPPHAYNERFLQSLHTMKKVFEEDFLILEKSLKDNTVLAFLIEGGHFRGYGKFEEDAVLHDFESARDIIKAMPQNPEADIIIRNYLWAHPNLDIRFPPKTNKPKP